MSKDKKMHWFKIVPLIVALSLSACNKPTPINDPGPPTPPHEVKVAEINKPANEQLYRLCKNGWILMIDGVKMYAPDGSNDRWVIAPSANEDKICTDGEPE